MEYACRGVIAVVLIVAAIGKLTHLDAFVVALRRLRIIPSEGFAALVSIGIPIIELVIGAMLIADILLRQAALVAVALFGVFTGVLVDRLVRGDIQEGCGCFGGGRGQLSWLHIARNLGLVLLALAIYYPTPLIGLGGMVLLGGGVIPNVVSGSTPVNRT